MMIALQPPRALSRVAVSVLYVSLAAIISVRVLAHIATGVPVSFGGDINQLAVVGGTLLAAGCFTAQPEVAGIGLFLIFISK